MITISVTSTIKIIVLFLLGIAIGLSLIELTYVAIKKVITIRAEKKSNKEIKSDCKVYHNKARGYYYLKERDARGKLVYMRGSYSYTEQEAREFCSNN